MEFRLQSCIRGYHVYGERWTALLGEELTCEREIGNVVDRYAVAVKKDTGETVGHVPKKISRICSSFLQRDNSCSDWSSQIFIRLGPGGARNSLQP